MCEPESPFYLQTHPSQDKDPFNCWYKCQPLGLHSLGNIMKSMATSASIPGRKTNHSGRKTTVERLRVAEFENTDIMQLTGQKNAQSLNEYSSVTAKKQRSMSNVLTNIESKKPAATVTKPDNTSNVENVDDFPIDDMDSILPSIENFEEIPIAQQPSKLNEPVANNTSHAMCTLNRSLGLGNALFSGACINGGTFNVNINLQSN